MNPITLTVQGTRCGDTEPLDWTRCGPCVAAQGILSPPLDAKRLGAEQRESGACPRDDRSIPSDPLRAQKALQTRLPTFLTYSHEASPGRCGGRGEDTRNKHGASPNKDVG